MTTIFYVLIAASVLIDTAAGIWLVAAGGQHPVAGWLTAMASGRTEAADAARYLVYFAALACFLAAAFQVLIWRWLRNERDEAHSLLMLYGGFVFVGGLLLFGAASAAADAADSSLPAWIFLIADSLRGALLVAIAAIARRTPRTLRELRLPVVRERTRSDRATARPAPRGPRPERRERAGRRTSRPERKSVAATQLKSGSRAETEAGRPQRKDRGTEKWARAETRERAGGRERGDTRERTGIRERTEQRGPAAPEPRPSVSPQRAAARADVFGSETESSPRRRSHRGGRGRRKTGAVEANRPAAGEVVVEPEVTEAISEPRPIESRAAEERPRRPARSRPARPISGGFRPPMQEMESQAEESVPAGRAASVEEIRPIAEWTDTVGSRSKKGRYSTGALFRPREKRVRRPLGGGEAIAEQDWSWPAHKEPESAKPPAESGDNEG